MLEFFDVYFTPVGQVRPKSFKPLRESVGAFCFSTLRKP